MKTEEFWDIYINSTENTLDVYDSVMMFFADKLPKNFVEEYDAVEIIIEVQGQHKTAKKFEKVIDLAKLIKEKHPDIFKKTSRYSNPFLLSYYTYHKNGDEIENIFTEISKDVVTDYDDFMAMFNHLLFNQYVDLIEVAVDPNFQAIRKSTELVDGAEYDLISIKLNNTLEKYYLTNKTSTPYSISKLSQDIRKYAFNAEVLQRNLENYESGLYGDNLDLKVMQQLLIKNPSVIMTFLQAQFMKTMLQKNFRFAVSGKIWEILFGYWYKYNDNSKKIFAINYEELKKHLSYLSGGFNSSGNVEKFALLWGSVFVYDFLLEKELINAQEHSNFIAISRELKGGLIVEVPSDLWKYNFIHKWQKPDSISEIEFVSEAKIFEKSLTFTQFKFLDFKKEVEPELATIGELSEYIIAEGIKTEKKWDTTLLDSIFNNNFFSESNQNEDDFFRRPSNLKPIVKDIKEKTGRNDSCHCGSGKKFKKCCM